jgi:hypothetical protein
MDKPTVRPVIGWVEEPIIRPRGGRAATQASNKKREAGDRLADLVGGISVGHGVENTDTLKAGDLHPVARLERLMGRMGALRARIDRALAETTETEGKARQTADLVAGLRRRLDDTRDEAMSLWRDMPSEMGTPDLAVRFMAAVSGQPRMGR